MVVVCSVGLACRPRAIGLEGGKPATNFHPPWPSLAGSMVFGSQRHRRAPPVEVPSQHLGCGRLGAHLTGAGQAACVHPGREPQLAPKVRKEVPTNFLPKLPATDPLIHWVVQGGSAETLRATPARHVLSTRKVLQHGHLQAHAQVAPGGGHDGQTAWPASVCSLRT